MACNLFFDNFLDSYEKKNNVGLKSNIVHSSTNINQCDFVIFAKALNFSSYWRSHVVHVFYLYYEKHSTREANSTDGPISDNDIQIIIPSDDASIEEKFIQLLWKSFLEVFLLSKQYKDEKINLSEGGVRDVYFYGLNQNAPSTPVTTNKDFSILLCVFQGPPINSRPNSRLKGASLGFVC